MPAIDTKPERPSSAKPCLIESSPNYSKILLDLGEFRIITCPADIQWIVQRRLGAGARWKGVQYTRTRETLFGALARLKIDLTPEQRSIIAALPLVCGRST